VPPELGPEAAERYDAESTAEVHRAFATELAEVDGVSRLVDHLHRAGVFGRMSEVPDLLGL
jgi:hypothetical protein